MVLLMRGRIAHAGSELFLHDVLSSFESVLCFSIPRSALGAQPPENKFAFTNNPLTKGARGRPWHVVPLDVLDIAAAVADEVVMRQAGRIESRGTALDGHFPHQTRLHQIP